MFRHFQFDMADRLFECIERLGFPPRFSENAHIVPGGVPADAQTVFFVCRALFQLFALPDGDGFPLFDKIAQRNGIHPGRSGKKQKKYEFQTHGCPP